MRPEYLFAFVTFVALSATPAAAQSPQWSVTFDANALAPDGHSFDTAGGASVNATLRTVALTPDGEHRWTYDACPGCGPNDPGSRTLASEILADGSGWLLTQTANTYAVVRVATDGTPQFSIDVFASQPPRTQFLLIADANRAIALATSGGAVAWARVSSTGAVLENRTHALADTRERSDARQTKVFADGSVGLSVEQTTPGGCQVSPPVNCLPPRTTVLRLEADGAERWRADLGDHRPARVVAFEDDGTSVVITTPPDADTRIATIAPDGTPGATATVPDSTGAYATHASGPVNGRYLIQTSPSSVTTLRLIDRTGATHLALPVDVLGYSLPVASGAYGFIVAAANNDGTLLAPDTLAPLAYFDIDGQSNASTIFLAREYWRMLPDGSVYTTKTHEFSSEDRARLSRFAVPGSPADDRIFRDAFERF